VSDPLDYQSIWSQDSLRDGNDASHEKPFPSPFAIAPSIMNRDPTANASGFAANFSSSTSPRLAANTGQWLGLQAKQYVESALNESLEMRAEELQGSTKSFLFSFLFLSFFLLFLRKLFSLVFFPMKRLTL
jgi:hypothetical protein